MMPKSPLFQDFGGGSATTQISVPSDVDIEEEKLSAFENGYQAGWEDAAKAQTETALHVSAALAVNLQDAAVDLQEMRLQLERTVQAILKQVVQTILPKAALSTLGQRICDEVGEQISGALDASVVIAVAPGSAPAVQKLMSDNIPSAFEVKSDPLLAPDQAVIRIANSETEINIGAVIAEIQDAISALFDTHENEATND